MTRDAARAIKLALLPLAAMSLSACQPRVEESRYYTGPTLGLSAVVARVNANNLRLPTLWTRQDLDGAIIDDKHNATTISTTGVILYRAPHELLITGNNEFGSAFEMGATDEFYWLKVAQGPDTMWWGRMRNAGKPCAAAMPVRPDLILDVLGIGALDPNLNHPPYTVMRFNNDVDVYMVDSIVPTADGMIVQKEIWYDRQTLLPGLVLLFDPDGRVVLRALLSNFQPVAIADTPQSQWPMIATTYKLKFIDTGSHLQFTLRDQALNKNGIPHAGSIHMPDLSNPGVKNVIQIDADCDKEGTTTSP
jgi:hypothetical protein